MTAAIVSVHSAILRRAARRALLAPSIHNTQPWKFVLTPGALEIHADFDRQLSVLDPRGRQLRISCGCALFNTRAAIAAAGYEAIVERLPDPERPELLARVSVGDQRRIAIAALDLQIDRRRTNRRAFSGDAVPPDVIRDLIAAARAEDGLLVPVVTAEHRAALARLSTLADQIERGDPAYLAEIFAWTSDDPRRSDGVQAASVPNVGGAVAHRDAVPIRGFDVRGMGWLPASSGSGSEQCLLLLCSHTDEPADWLRTGEALERTWLELTRHGFWASPLTQVVEVRGTHEQLRHELGLLTHPEILLRVGRAPETVRTLRRAPSEMIVEIEPSDPD